MKTVAIIPARMQSSRYPGKPLAKICDRSMIEHVYVRTNMAKSVYKTYITTCDEEIRREAERFGADVIMTADSHIRCTERAAEAVQNIACDAIVLVQGDEPLIYPEMIDQVAEPLRNNRQLSCTNLMGAIDSSNNEITSTNVVKVVYAQDFSALYMSRACIPLDTKKIFESYAKQLGVMAFRKNCLLEYVKLSPTPLEQAESVDMLRFIEHGIAVRMVPCVRQTIGVDTPQDLIHATQMMETDELFLRYVKQVPEKI